MSVFDFFRKKINTDILRLSQIAYGGEFYYGLSKYTLKEIDFKDRFQKVNDTLLARIGNTKYFSYKNLDSGFVGNVFENKKTGNLVIAFRGTERIGLGENFSDVVSLAKDIMTDTKFITAETDEQFSDAYDFYKQVESLYSDRKIIITGHSLGGGLAQLVGAKVFSDTGKKLEVYSYNAPGCKHLLEIFGCNPVLDYSFITNYTVMNDWCGMFGENIGKTYLIPSIELSEINSDSVQDIMKNVLLKTHEGIFEYSGRIYCKPSDFNQKEGLSLWYYDKNNPLKDVGSISDYLNSFIPKILPFMNMEQTIKNKTADFITEQKIKLDTMDIDQSISEPLKNLADNLLTMTSDNSEPQVNMAESVSRFFDMTISELTEDTYQNALKIAKRIK